MPQLEPPFDAIITDPPYGTNDGRGKVHKISNSLVKFDVGDWDKLLPLLYIGQAINLLDYGCWITIFTDNLSVKIVWDEIEKNGGNGKQTFYWIKTNPPPQPRDNFCSGVETSVLATKGPVKKWYGGGWYKNYYECPIVTDRNRTDHPTQKPEQVINYLQQAITTTSDIIFDPFMGSGTTLVAAQNEGRRAIGIEISEEYCKIAVERLRQPSLFSIVRPEPKVEPEQLELDNADHLKKG
jgi:DNA modification methylase